MNKLDLIFEKEPPEVQRKLMNLLIQYNAIMQYNKDDDKFQVDLLLPFKTPKQKQQFIQNFKSRPHKKQQNTNQLDADSQSRNRSNSRRLRSQSSSNQHTFLSANQKILQNNDRSEQSSQVAKQNMHFNNYDEQQISLDFTNEQQNSRVSHSYNIKDISIVIQNKLKNAVKQIKLESKLSKNSGNVTHNYQQNSQYSHPYQEGTLHLKQVLVDHNQANEQNYQFQEMENQDSQPFSKQYSSKYSSINKNKNMHNNYLNQQSNMSSIIHNEMKIQEHSQSQNQRNNKKIALQNYRSNHENNHIKPKVYNDEEIWIQNDDETLFKNESDKKSQHKQQNKQDEYKTVSNGQQYNKNTNNEILIQDKQKQKKLKQNLANKYKTRKPSQVNVTSVRERYSQFMKKSYKQFDKIYENIKKDIKRNDKQLRKSRRQDPILVLQSSTSDNNSQEQKIFKQQMIKDYQKRIIIQNKYLSSEDLVRYFKYLLEHAKTLYVKQLRKGR